MFNYRKRLFYPVHIEAPDPEFARVLLEHYGGKDGELTTATQYLNHRSLMTNRYIRELYGLITSEEMSHLEMIGAAINKLEGTLSYTNSRGKLWKASYIEEVATPLELLEVDVEAEKRARALYHRHIAQTKDPGLKKMLNFLSTREEVHKHLFQKAKMLMEQEHSQEDFYQLIYEYRMSLQVLE